MPPVEPDNEVNKEKLEEDNDTPFSAPDPGRDDPAVNEQDSEEQSGSSSSASQYPSTDDGVDSQEFYDQGLDVKEPNQGNSVAGYSPGGNKDGDDKDESEEE
jgi:hypothetical protein